MNASPGKPRLMPMIRINTAAPQTKREILRALEDGMKPVKSEPSAAARKLALIAQINAVIEKSGEGSAPVIGEALLASLFVWTSAFNRRHDLLLGDIE